MRHYYELKSRQETATYIKIFFTITCKKHFQFLYQYTLGTNKFILESLVSLGLILLHLGLFALGCDAFLLLVCALRLLLSPQHLLLQTLVLVLQGSRPAPIKVYMTTSPASDAHICHSGVQTCKRKCIIIIYHDSLPTSGRGSHVKSDKTHTQSSRYSP